MKTLMIIWKNKGLILEGVINRIFKRDPIEIIAKKRLAICKKCPLYDTIGTKCITPGTHPCCEQCGCTISFKVRSLSSSCPHPDGPKWKEEKL